MSNTVQTTFELSIPATRFLSTLKNSASFSIMVLQRGNLAQCFHNRRLTDEEKEMDRNKQLLFRNEFCNLVDNFQTYLQELYCSILVLHPLLNGNAPLDAETVFKHKDLDALKLTYAKKVARELSFKSISKQSQDIHRHWKFDLFSDPKIANQIEEIVRIRNLLTHNRGELPAGDRIREIVFHGTEISSAIRLLFDSVMRNRMYLAAESHSKKPGSRIVFGRSFAFNLAFCQEGKRLMSGT